MEDLFRKVNERSSMFRFRYLFLLRQPQSRATRRSFLSHIKLKLSIYATLKLIATLICKL